MNRLDYYDSARRRLTAIHCRVPLSNAVSRVTSSTNVNAAELSSDPRTTPKLGRTPEAVTKRLLLLGSGALIITLTVVGGCQRRRSAYVGVPDKERTIAEYDWTGPYVGAHVGYAGGPPIGPP